MNPQKISFRERQILAGLFLSKYDSAGLKELEFKTYKEAFNIIGYALGAKPASIKNYRDEFDPIFSKIRRGWHKRQRRDYCLDIAEKYKTMDMCTMADIVRSFFPAEFSDESINKAKPYDSAASFAKRLATGLAAEHYFQSHANNIEEFRLYEIEETTKYGCGYDFRLWPSDSNMYIVVEVKGIMESKGALNLTEKEYSVAQFLRERYVLFVVKNFKETPFHEIYVNPLDSMRFDRQESIIVQTTWKTRV